MFAYPTRLRFAPMPRPRNKPPAASAAEPNRWRPLLPPPKNKWLLLVAAALLLAWIAFLLYLALRS